MTTTYKLTYDPSQAQAAFKLVVQAIRELEAAGAKVPPGLAQIAKQMENVEDSAKGADDKVEGLAKDLAAIAKQADKAGDELSSFAVSTQSVGKSSTVVSQGLGSLGSSAGGTTDRVSRLKDAAGGLDAILTTLGLSTLGNLAGAIERLVVGYKDLAAASAVSEVASYAVTEAKTKETVSTVAASTADTTEAASKAAATVATEANTVATTENTGAKELEALATSAAAQADERQAAAFAISSATLAKGAVVISSLVAIVSSLYVLYQDWAETIEQVADKNSLLDGTLLKVLNSLGLISEETLNTSETLKAEQEALDAATRAMKEHDKATSAAQEAEAKLQKTLEEKALAFTRSIEKTREEASAVKSLKEISDPEELKRQVDELSQELDKITRSGKLTQETFERYSSGIEKLEARRIEALEEQEAKQKELADKEKEAQAERSERLKKSLEEDKAAREAEVEAFRQAEEEKQQILAQQEQDAYDKKLELLKKELGGVEAVGDERTKQYEEEKARQAEAEGQQQQQAQPSNPYAAALDPLGNALASGFGEDISGGGLVASGSPSDAGGGPSRGDLIAQLAEQKRLARPDISRKNAQKEARAQVSEDLADGSIDDPEVQRANEELVRKNVELQASIKGLTEEQTKLMTDLALGLVETKAQAAKAERDTAEARKLLASIFGGGGQNFRPGRPRQ
ncbi:MAG: hypothetical protein EB060_11035 [Proteobacteria bacterium]|nr:hypothetical protein [Pseudomonadota bacterium]